MGGMKYLEKNCFLCGNVQFYVSNHDDEDTELDISEIAIIQILCENCYEKQKENITLMTDGEDE